MEKYKKLYKNNNKSLILMFKKANNLNHFKNISEQFSQKIKLKPLDLNIKKILFNIEKE